MSCSCNRIAPVVDSNYGSCLVAVVTMQGCHSELRGWVVPKVPCRLFAGGSAWRNRAALLRGVVGVQIDLLTRLVRTGARCDESLSHARSRSSDTPGIPGTTPPGYFDAVSVDERNSPPSGRGNGRSLQHALPVRSSNSNSENGWRGARELPFAWLRHSPPAKGDIEEQVTVFAPDCRCNCSNPGSI